MPGMGTVVGNGQGRGRGQRRGEDIPVCAPAVGQSNGEDWAVTQAWGRGHVLLPHLPGGRDLLSLNFAPKESPQEQAGHDAMLTLSIFGLRMAPEGPAVKPAASGLTAALCQHTWVLGLSVPFATIL